MNLYYIGEFDFNRGQAATVRIINNCKSISQNKCYNIKIIGYSDIPQIKIDSLQVLNVKRGKSLTSKLFNYILRPFFIIRLIKRTKIIPDTIIYYGSSTRTLLPILIYCKKRKIKLIVDIVEWYDYSHLPLGRFGPMAFDVHIALTKLIPKCNGVIAISSYLQNYYQQKGMKTLRVPILVDAEIKEQFVLKDMISFDTNCLNLIYAGYAGKKDLINNVIEAVNTINNNDSLVKLHILGTSANDLREIYTKALSKNILFYGKLPHHIVPYYLKQADFSILLRPNKRYANAGFPTKFVESMEAGLPVIANLTSDLSYYLHDGINGFIVDGYSAEALVVVLNKIILENKNHLKFMKIKARQTAIENFDFHLYSDQFNQFIKDVCK